MTLLPDFLRVIARAVSSVSPFLGKMGKGKATVTGVVATALGIGVKQFIGNVVTAENVVEVIRALADVVTALGTVVAAFGFGRKTGYAATRETE